MNYFERVKSTHWIRKVSPLIKDDDEIYHIRYKNKDYYYLRFGIGLIPLHKEASIWDEWDLRHDLKVQLWGREAVRERLRPA